MLLLRSIEGERPAEAYQEGPSYMLKTFFLVDDVIKVVVILRHSIIILSHWGPNESQISLEKSGM